MPKDQWKRENERRLAKRLRYKEATGEIEPDFNQIRHVSSHLNSSNEVSSISVPIERGEEAFMKPIEKMFSSG